jgi:hypothetical protein
LRGNLRQVFLGDDVTLLEQDLALVVDEFAVRRPADEDLTNSSVKRIAQNLDLFVTSTLDAHLLVILDVPRALVLLRALA